MFVWAGALAVTANALSLGYRLPLLPSIAFFGYSLTPLSASALLLHLLPPPLRVARVLLVLLGLGWAAAAALKILDLELALEDRRLLAAYPVVLFLTVLAWLLVIG